MEGPAAQALHIHPPHTVHIDVDGWDQDWPNDCVHVEPNCVLIIDPVYLNPIIRYPYVHAQRLDDGTWSFIGPEHDFTVSPGPAELPSMDTAGP